ncbi:hypothetical protein B0H67DRAFT_646188 [Lasiosphaeris hirsuta]|uniref:Uncharacterized protein n=1 Tax=Lasiosphaeris hirsuta TaxID=260670 RepID=A0AA40A7V5_9PEZI|nr:hypothetical protein B0H67DRAFT_646188 [Lasiosphaeris hirsuta]
MGKSVIQKSIVKSLNFTDVEIRSESILNPFENTCVWDASPARGTPAMGQLSTDAGVAFGKAVLDHGEAGLGQLNNDETYPSEPTSRGTPQSLVVWVNRSYHQFLRLELKNGPPEVSGRPFTYDPISGTRVQPGSCEAGGAASMGLVQLAAPTNTLAALGELKAIYPAEASSIAESLTIKANGVFLWVALGDALSKGESLNSLQTILDELPSDIHLPYNAIWERICATSPDAFDTSLCLLQAEVRSLTCHRRIDMSLELLAKLSVFDDYYRLHDALHLFATAS